MKKWMFKANDGEESQQSVPEQTPIILTMPPTAKEQWSPVNIKVVDNKVLFYSDIDSASCAELNRVLLEVDARLQAIKTAIGNDYSPICHLHLCTPGGEIFPAFAVVDTIRRMKSTVYTYIDGMVASAGTLISIAGNKRFMGKHAHLLIHQLSGGVYGKYDEMEDAMHNSTNIMKLLKNFYKERTKIPMKKLEEILKKDLYMISSECLSYGIIDEII